jgi:U1 small nuclear ribonucleoprotein
MTQFLPQNLLGLFAPRDPIPYLGPTDKLRSEKKEFNYSGVAQFLAEFEVNLIKIIIVHVGCHTGTCIV